MPRTTTKRAARKPKSDYGAYVGASILPGEPSYAVTGRNARDEQAVARAVMGTIATALNINTTVLVQQTIRLMRPARGSDKVWRGAKIKSRKRMDWYTGQLGHSPGHKAVMYAAQAGEVEEVVEHPVLDLLRDPDVLCSSYDWFYLVHWFKQSVGRFYSMLADPVGSAPTSLLPLFPQWTTIVPSEDGRLIGGYIYGRDTSEQIKLEPECVMMMREAPGFNHPLGASCWAQGVLKEVDLQNAAMTTEIARWLNGGQPSGIFKGDPKLNDDQMRQAKADLERQMRGVAKAGGFLTVRNLEFVPNNIKPMEMNYAVGMEYVDKAVFRAAGIPETIWKMADANKASAVAGDPTYMRLTINPRLCKFADELTLDLLPKFGVEPGEMWFCYDDPVREDRAALVAEYKTLTDSGLAFPNEARSELGFEPFPEKYNILRYMGVPIELVGIPPAPVEPAPDEEDETPEPEPKELEPAAPDGEKMATGLHRLARSVHKGELPQENAERIAQLSWPHTVVAGVFDDLKCEHVNGTAVKDKVIPVGASNAAFEKWAASLGAWLNRAIGGLELVGDSIELRADEELAAILKEGLQTAYREAAVEAAGKVGAEAVVPTDPLVLAYVERRALELATSVTGTAKERVRAIIGSTLREGTTSQDVRDAIKDVAPQLAEYQASTIARTETTNATNQARVDVWTRSGVTMKMWDASGDPCPICTAIQRDKSKPIPMDAPFYKAGDTLITTAGDVIVFDAPLYQPAAHPNCRCSVLPVFENEDGSNLRSNA